MHCAAEKGHTEIAELLLLAKYGVDINAQDNYGMTALHYAVKNGRTEVVELLLANEGVEANAPDNMGRTALYLAAEHGDTKTAELILTDMTPESINLLLLDSITTGNSVLAGLALTHGADIDRLEGVDSLLMVAVYNGGRDESDESIAMVRLLLENGARLDYFNSLNENVFDVCQSKPKTLKILKAAAKLESDITRTVENDLKDLSLDDAFEKILRLANIGITDEKAQESLEHIKDELSEFLGKKKEFENKPFLSRLALRATGYAPDAKGPGHEIATWVQKRQKNDGPARSI